MPSPTPPLPCKRALRQATEGYVGLTADGIKGVVEDAFAVLRDDDAESPSAEWAGSRIDGPVPGPTFEGGPKVSSQPPFHAAGVLTREHGLRCTRDER